MRWLKMTFNPLIFGSSVVVEGTYSLASAGRKGDAESLLAILEIFEHRLDALLLIGTKLYGRWLLLCAARGDRCQMSAAIW